MWTRPIAANVAAAWRRRGFHCRSHGRKTCKFAQTFRRVTAPLAPNRSLAAGFLSLFTIFFLLFGKNNGFASLI
jgi:hypothetical protein